jgi:hypothetical protein
LNVITLAPKVEVSAGGFGDEKAAVGSL